MSAEQIKRLRGDVIGLRIWVVMVALFLSLLECGPRFKQRYRDCQARGGIPVQTGALLTDTLTCAAPLRPT